MRFPFAWVVCCPRILHIYISLVISFPSMVVNAAEDIQFNMDVLDVNDRKNIDLSKFSRSGYIMPGTYGMVVHVNKTELSEQTIQFFALSNDLNGSRACVNRELVDQFGLKSNAVKKITWWHENECFEEESLPGVEIKGDLSTSALYISIPQEYLEYTSDNWVPPSRWEEGLPGVLFDYNVNTQTYKYLQSGSNGYNLSGNGTAGTNVGAWRFRADWQANIDHQTGSGKGTGQNFDWSRYYAYRAIPALHSKFVLGDNYLDSGMFDSFRFTGASLISDDNMLPPNLRGYAPEIVGVSKTNAKVTVSQQGRVLYETQVAAGPFRIQDLNNAVTGELNVRVEEQDGSVQEFTVSTATIPYLARPGSVRFKLATGKPSDMKHHYRGPIFATGEAAWGISNGWSLYGGLLGASDYNALSVGIGRDLMMFGALSFDVTQSRANLPREDSTLSGGSYRLSYSKNFDEYDSQVTFAGYRFSEQNFMSMSEYLDMREYGYMNGSGKEMYTITFSKHFRDFGISSYLNYSHETYWDRPSNNRYNFTMSRYFNVGDFRNVSMSVSAYRNELRGIRDSGGFLSLTLPWGNNSTISYSGSVNNNDINHRLSYYDRIDDRNSYQLSAGSSRNGPNLSGYYTHDGDAAQFNGNASYQENNYSAFGMNMQGGITMTTKGGALHRNIMNGGTRMLVNTGGVAGVPVRGYGNTSSTNLWGKAVISDVNSYYLNQVSIDLEKLSDNVEATRSVSQITLTEGAIGYREFDVIAGLKAMAVIKMVNGDEPPFGASVMNSRKQEVGIVNDGGSVYLSGIKEGEVMTVHWGEREKCDIQIPSSLPTNLLMDNLLLPCK